LTLLRTALETYDDVKFTTADTYEFSPLTR